MRFIVQVRIEPDTHTTSDVIDIAVIERDVLSPATLGLTIEEAKGLLAGVQNVVATEHCADALSNVEHCEDCGRRFAHKDQTASGPQPVWDGHGPEPEVVDLYLYH